jgi:predicted metal-dependent HD superfamily phosphohydrolase
MVKAIAKQCARLISESRCKTLPFHNLVHTREVVDNVRHIAKWSKLDIEETEPMIIATWFHDAGFSKRYNGHEDVSKELAKTILKKEGYDSQKTEVVISCIDATKMPQQPQNRYADVLCDADVMHIATPNFFIKNSCCDANGK